MAVFLQGSTSSIRTKQLESVHQPAGGDRDGSAAPPARSASEDGRGGEAAPRLEKRIHLDNGKYRINLRNYGKGLAEIGWSFASSVRPGRVGRGLSDGREEHEKRAVRHARSRIRHLILSAGADHLLTLTYRDNVTDFDRACADLSKFVRTVKAKRPGWVYIAVPERQKRGAWHWHMAVRGRQDVVLLRSIWRHIVGEGNIDVNPPRGVGKQRTLALVKYLGKYLAKGFSEGNRVLNGRRFRASLQIPIPCESFTLPPAERDNVSGYALARLHEAAGAIGFVWSSEEQLAGWACSWK